MSSHSELLYIEYDKLSFNCMTYSIAVLDVGLGYPGGIKHGPSGNVDHPNDHITRYMNRAVEAGFFDHRMADGKLKANSTEAIKDIRINGREILGIRHHRKIDCVSYTDQKTKAR